VDLAVVVLVCTLVRLPWVLFVRHGLVWDSTFYFFTAKAIAAGHGYAIHGHPTAFFPVGWPALLGLVFAVTGPSLIALMVVNLVLWAVITALVYLLGRRLGGRATGIVAALVIAVSPTLTMYVMRAYSEALFIPLLLIVCLILGRRRETPTLRMAALAGICLGLAILVRSTAAPLTLILPLWLLLRRPWRESWRAALTLCVAACFAVAPWVVRNTVLMHSPVLSTNGGFTLHVADHFPKVRGAPRHIFRWPIESARDEVRQNSALTREAVSYMVHDTGHWLRHVPSKFMKLMGWDTAPIVDALFFQQGPHPLSGFTRAVPGLLIRGALDHTWIFRVWHYAFWALGGIAMVLALWRRKPAAGLILLIVAFWIVFHSVFFFGDVRFMISVTPLVAAPLAWMLVHAPLTFRRVKTGLPATG
jgi:4-amino-4-deoxy-L-arabinose transferase-like glycosyltransferase